MLVKEQRQLDRDSKEAAKEAEKQASVVQKAKYIEALQVINDEKDKIAAMAQQKKQYLLDRKTLNESNFQLTLQTKKARLVKKKAAFHLFDRIQQNQRLSDKKKLELKRRAVLSAILNDQERINQLIGLET